MDEDSVAWSDLYSVGFEPIEARNMEPVEMARYLKKWLLNHIAICDKKYMPYLAKN